MATWNARESLPRGGRDVSARPGVVEELLDIVSQTQIDVLALQEVDYDAYGSSLTLDALVTRSHLRHSCARPLSDSAFVPHALSGLALVSRFPLQSCSARLLPNPGLRARRGSGAVESFDKGLVFAVIRLGDLPVTVSAVHCTPYHFFGRDARDPDFEHIWAALAREVEQLPGQAVVLAGDFNTSDRSLLLKMTGRPLRRTLTGGLGSRRRDVDDILYAPPLSLAAAPSVVTTASDHDLFLVDFVVGRLPED